MANRYEEILKLVKKHSASVKFNEGDLPTLPDGKREKANYVNSLFEDAEKFKRESFGIRRGISDPEEFWNRCAKLENGEHWEVWGRRLIDEVKDKWKAELIDDEITNQIRIKVAYLTANWHQFDILPNINNINEILTQELELTGWGERIIEIVKKQCIYGSVFLKSYIDYDLDPRGIANEMILDHKNIFFSPYATSLTKQGNLWYIIHATVLPRHLVLLKYANSMKQLGVTPEDIDAEYLNLDKLKPLSISDNRSFVNSLSQSRLIDVMEMYIDDYTDIENPFDEGETTIEHTAILQGIKPPVLKQQNHKKHVESHLRFLAEVNNEISPEDEEKVNVLNAVVEYHILEHLQYRMDGRIEKYPYGRRIVKAGNTIIEDVPNPYSFDWRRLFHVCYYESSQGNLFGRGMVEMLWNTNLTEDLMISRLADIGLFGIPKPWLNEETRRLIDRDGYDIDPTIPGYYIGAPPQFPQTRSPIEFLHAYKIMKENAEKNYGISSVTYGEAPTASASGDLVEILLRQNSIVVTGEASMRLNELVKDIIETRFEIMKQFYVEDRPYYINGRYESISVSKILHMQPVFDDVGNPVRDEMGNILEEPIPKIEVKVKPNSNLPNQWEIDFSILTRLIGITAPDGTPLVPVEALRDVLAVRYPQFGKGGKYYQISQATQIGMQVLAQQQMQMQQQMQQEKDIADVVRSVNKSKIKEQIKQQETIPEEGQQLEQIEGEQNDVGTQI